MAMKRRSLKELSAAEDELFAKIWYERHQVSVAEAWEQKICPDCAGLSEGERAARALEEKYGAENLGPYDDFEWGMLGGKLSALRWVLGDEWDMLDS